MSEEVFWSKVDTSGVCWEWTAGRNGNYGKAPRAFRHISALAHRVGYTLLVGDIPSGLVIDHICRNTLCVNPDHLEAVTQQENFRRGQHRSAIACHTDVCFKGHALSPENSIVREGKRTCRTCNRAWQRRYRQLNPERVRGYDRARKRRRSADG